MASGGEGDEAQGPVVHLVGTFDLANYGDLLLPAITEQELLRRIPDLRIRRFAPYGWEHPVPMDAGVLAEPLGAPTDERRAEVARCDLLVIGGGEIIHFHDHLLAPHYDVTADDVVTRAPSTWFVDGTGVDHAVPTAWNAVGIPFDIDDGRAEMVRAAAGRHRHVAVRDDTSRKRLEQLGVDREIDVVPDPGFLVPRLFDVSMLDRRRRLHATLGWAPPGRYVVVQGNGSMLNEVDRMGMALDAALVDHPDVSVVVLETGAGHGDGGFAEKFVRHYPTRTWRPDAPLLPVDLAAMLAGAEAFVGVSLHGAVTTIAHGRRAVVFNAPRQSKLRGIVDHLGDRTGYAETADELPEAIRWAMSAMGPDPALGAITRAVDAHFDRVATVVEASHAGRDEGFATLSNRPSRLAREAAALRTAHEVRGRRLVGERDALAGLIDERDQQVRRREGEAAALRGQIDSLQQQVDERDERIAELEAQMADQRRRTDDALAQVAEVHATKTMRLLRWPRRLYARARR